ncbi:MAG: hypothetical protein ACFFDF_19805 [Candidatus Odinarchaeota archaeon]
MTEEEQKEDTTEEFNNEWAWLDELMIRKKQGSHGDLEGKRISDRKLRKYQKRCLKNIPKLLTPLQSIDLSFIRTWILIKKRISKRDLIALLLSVKTDTMINSAYIKDTLVTMESTQDKTKNIEDAIIYLKNQERISFRERILQNLLAKYPQIIEADLKYLEEEYKLGNTNYRGDLLFLDSSSKRLNVELKVVIPSFNDFSNQMTNYLENVGGNERIMYITSDIREDQKQFCLKNNIEVKIIDLNEILKW